GQRALASLGGPDRDLQRRAYGRRGHGGQRLPRLLDHGQAEQGGGGPAGQPTAAARPPRGGRAPRARRPAPRGGGPPPPRRAAGGRGASWASSPRMATISGCRSSRSVAYRLAASTRAIRRATMVSSRSSRRYHGELPRASLTWWNPSSPASGLAASANQPSIT